MLSILDEGLDNHGVKAISQHVHSIDDCSDLRVSENITGEASGSCFHELSIKNEVLSVRAPGRDRFTDSDS